MRIMYKVEATTLRQLQRTLEVVDRYRAYAAQIGCVLGTGSCCDEIECNEEQSRLLTTWWDRETSTTQ